jgi:hypothetical protein
MSDAPPSSMPVVPQAVLKPVRRRWLGWYALFPGLALVVVSAVVLLGWWQRGPAIVVHFREGHGLKPGDTVRCRGITVGEVRSVELASDLRGVDVAIDLRPTAAPVAVDGSRFWIVRPQADLTRLSGLDTVVGAKYIAVFPGSGMAKREFVGAEEAPVVEKFEPGGLEIVLVGKRLGGLRPGVQLTYRQVRIGTVLSARLASDASAVDVRVYVPPAYASLVRDNSVFWNTSGIRLGLGWRSGLTFDAESAQTVLAGGVAMATPDRPGKPAAAGKRFDLADEPPKDLKERWNPSIPLVDPHLPPGTTVPQLVRATLQYTVKRSFGRRGQEEERGLLLPVGKTWLLGPEDLLSVSSRADGGKADLAFAGTTLSLSAGNKKAGALRWLEITDPKVREQLGQSLAEDRLRPPSEREDCLLVSDSAGSPLFVPAAQMTRPGDGWTIDTSLSRDLVRESWHGAAAVSVADGKVIGLLVCPKAGDRSPPRIVPLTKELLRR